MKQAAKQFTIEMPKQFAAKLRKMALENQLNPDVAEKYYKEQMKTIDDFVGP